MFIQSCIILLHIHNLHVLLTFPTSPAIPASTRTQSDSSGGIIGGTVAGVLILVAVAAILVILMFFYRRHYVKQKVLEQMQLDILAMYVYTYVWFLQIEYNERKRIINDKLDEAYKKCFNVHFSTLSALTVASYIHYAIFYRPGRARPPVDINIIDNEETAEVEPDGKGGHLTAGQAVPNPYSRPWVTVHDST